MVSCVARNPPKVQVATKYTLWNLPSPSKTVFIQMCKLEFQSGLRHCASIHPISLPGWRACWCQKSHYIWMLALWDSFNKTNQRIHNKQWGRVLHTGFHFYHLYSSNRQVIFNLILIIYGWGMCEITLKWMLWGLNKNKQTHSSKQSENANREREWERESEREGDRDVWVSIFIYISMLHSQYA